MWFTGNKTTDLLRNKQRIKKLRFVALQPKRVEGYPRNLNLKYHTFADLSSQKRLSIYSPSKKGWRCAQFNKDSQSFLAPSLLGIFVLAKKIQEVHEEFQNKQRKGGDDDERDSHFHEKHENNSKNCEHFHSSHLVKKCRLALFGVFFQPLDSLFEENRRDNQPDDNRNVFKDNDKKNSKNRKHFHSHQKESCGLFLAHLSASLKSKNTTIAGRMTGKKSSTKNTKIIPRIVSIFIPLCLIWQNNNTYFQFLQVFFAKMTIRAWQTEQSRWMIY